MLFIQLFLSFVLFLLPVQSEPIPGKQSPRKAPLLVDFDASRGDDPKILGTLNLEKAKGDRPKANTADLYIKSDKDWQGTKAAHFHHKAGYRRAEYHALKGQTKAGTTYFIAYKLALEQLADGLIIFQWKEYKANNAKDGGANIPLVLILRNKKLEFGHSEKWGEKGHGTQWTVDVEPHKEYKIGLEIFAQAKGGHAKLWFNGKPVTFDTTKSQVLTGNMYPGQSDPKFGIYGGQDEQVDSYVYQVQIGTSKDDLDQSYFGN
ncbi:uncharacterized protein F4822DRAFT_425608 [Hypoxylon trugodes]|uniref:uncharacterized protein n=1 Tax=Hypoxylon trugodes TaxID=326681 RepID=UPI00219967D2|nr:uncharacterized protein F4822DRAFT_425608 [Hypoxylon trugodes]KAI1392398.1 hypothetical protein F4822DRAFT_425608 [Hypoxylon trugodes]